MVAGCVAALCFTMVLRWRVFWLVLWVSGGVEGWGGVGWGCSRSLHLCFGKRESAKKELPENLWKRDGFQDVLC